jgi:hypothetical protein
MTGHRCGALRRSQRGRMEGWDLLAGWGGFEA